MNVRRNFRFTEESEAVKELVLGARVLRGHSAEVTKRSFWKLTAQTGSTPEREAASLARRHRCCSKAHGAFAFVTLARVRKHSLYLLKLYV